MIDRPKRDLLAQALRHLVAGVITNDQFDYTAVESLDSDDPATLAVYESAWGLYSDVREHRLRGRHALPPTARCEIARWIAFLYSDLEYEWAAYEHLVPEPGCLLSVVTLGRAAASWRRRLDATMQELGDWHLWPFMYQADLESVRQKPYLLSGANSSQRS